MPDLKTLISIGLVAGLIAVAIFLSNSETEKEDNKITTNAQIDGDEQEKPVTPLPRQSSVENKLSPTDNGVLQKIKTPPDRKKASRKKLPPPINLEETEELILDDFEIKEMEEKGKEKKLMIIKKGKPLSKESKTTKNTKPLKQIKKTEGKKKCTQFNQIILSKQKILNRDEQKQIFLKYLGKCIEAKAIKALLADISALYTAKGYITTKAYLLPQNISSGTIKLKVITGFIEEIAFADQTVSNWQIKTAFAWMIGEPLNIRDLESGLENISRLPSNDPTFTLLPGKSRGGTKVVIKNKKSLPARVSFGVTGEGSGEKNQSLTAKIEYDNLLNLNDILTLSYNGSRIQREYQGNNGYELNYSFPVGSLLFGIVLSTTSYKQEVIGLNDTYLSSGNTYARKLSVNKTLSRGIQNRFDLKTSITHRATKNYFEEELIEVSSYKTSVAQMDLIHIYNMSVARINSRISYFRGLDWFGARKDSDVVEVDFDKGPKFQFSKYVFDLNSLFYPTRNRSTWSINSNFHLQTSNDMLHSANQLIVGNSYTVRGYNRRHLIGNQGWYLKNDLKRGFNIGLSGNYLNRFSLYAGFDTGEILCGESEIDNCGKIDALAVGFTTSGNNLTSELTWSKPLTAIGKDFKYSQVFRYSIFFRY
jgi:hemolysin activation/secretion protein